MSCVYLIDKYYVIASVIITINRGKYSDSRSCKTMYKHFGWIITELMIVLSVMKSIVFC